MWVFCGGMQRSGSTLQFQLTAHLIEMVGKGERQAWMTPEELPKVLQYDDDRLKIVKTHTFTEAIAQEFTQGRAMGVYVYRDLRDVIVSFMQKESIDFHPDWVKRRIDNNIRWFHQWTRQPRTLISCYETMIGDVAGEVERLANHFAINISKDEAQAIADEYAVDRQKSRISQTRDVHYVNDTAVFDQHSLLHGNHISQSEGQVGYWREVLTVAQIAMLEAMCGEWLESQGYTLST